jgi:hypothetical protein
VTTHVPLSSDRPESNISAKRLPPPSVQLSFTDAVRLSLRFFLPMKVALASQWEPSDQYLWKLKFSDYATLLQLLFWIQGTLRVAALQGLLRTHG